MKSIVYNSDCLAAMREMPDKAFDLAIVDPPYGVGDFRGSPFSRTRHKHVHWNDTIPTAEYFAELSRVTVNRIIWGVNYYENYVSDKGRIVHDKTGGGKRYPPKEMSECDIASHNFGTNMKIWHYTWIGNVTGDGIDWNYTSRIHPCQKPVALYKWLLTNYAKPGQTILDTHLGSGSSRIAAYDLGFDFTGYELDTDYFEAQERRFADHIAQPKLFSPEPIIEQQAMFATI